MPGSTSNPSTVPYFSISRRLYLLDEVVSELLKDGHWTVTLKEKLTQMEELIVTVSDPDFGYWTKKMAIYWKRYAALKGDPTMAGAISAREGLLEGDSWKIIISKGTIIVTESDGQMKSLQFEPKGKKESETVQRIDSGSGQHLHFKVTPGTSVPIQAKGDLYSPDVPPGGRQTNGGDNCGQQARPPSANSRPQPQATPPARVSYQQTPPASAFRGRSQSCTRIGAPMNQGPPSANFPKPNEFFYGNGQSQGKAGHNLANNPNPNQNLPSGGSQCEPPAPQMINNIRAASNGTTGANNQHSVVQSGAPQTQPPKPLRSSKQLQGGKSVSIESSQVKQHQTVSSTVSAKPPPSSSPDDDTFNWLQDEPKAGQLKSDEVTPGKVGPLCDEQAVTGATNRYMENQQNHNFETQQQQQQVQGPFIKECTFKPARMPPPPAPTGVPSAEVPNARPPAPTPVMSSAYCFRCYTVGHSESGCTNKKLN